MIWVLSAPPPRSPNLKEKNEFSLISPIHYCDVLVETHGRHCPPFHGNLTKNSNVFIHVCLGRTKTTSFECFQIHIWKVWHGQKRNRGFNTLKLFKKTIHLLIDENSWFWCQSWVFNLMRCRTQICTFMLLHLSCVSRLVFVEGVFVHCILHFGLQYLGGVSLCICIFTAAFLALKLLQPLSRILRGTKSQNSNLLQYWGRFL